MKATIYLAHTDTIRKAGRCLSVDVDKQVFYCFQCARGGTVITYEQMRLNESSAMEAAQSLASIYSIKTPLPDETDDQRTRRLNFSEERKIAVSIIGKAFDLYHSNMTDEQRDYFRGRGVNDATIDELKLGYAPPGGRWLVERIYEFFKNKEQLLSSGLFFEDKQGKLRDRYIDRYLIPYWHRNDIVFSVGRSIDPEVEKTKKYVKHLTNSERYPFVSKTLYQIMWNEGEYQAPSENTSRRGRNRRGAGEGAFRERVSSNIADDDGMVE